MFKNSKEATANANHKNRKYSILLLALLFIGVATYGTYAYFTDSKSVDGQLALTKGQVSLGEISKPEWTYEGNSEQLSPSSFSKYNADLSNGSENASGVGSLKGTAFTNVLPGDTFTTKITMDYTGSVAADGKIMYTKVNDKNVQYSVTVSGGNLTGNQQLVANTEKVVSLVKDDKITFDLEVYVPYVSSEENYEVDGSRNDGKAFLDSLTNAIEVSVQQHLATTSSSN